MVSEINTKASAVGLKKKNKAVPHSISLTALSRVGIYLETREANQQGSPPAFLFFGPVLLFPT